MIQIAFGNARFLGAALQTLIIKDKTTSCQYLFVQKIHPVPVFPAPGFFARAQNMGCFQGMIPVFPQYGAEYVENLSGWTAGSRLVFPFRTRKGNEKSSPFRCGFPGKRLLTGVSFLFVTKKEAKKSHRSDAVDAGWGCGPRPRNAATLRRPIHRPGGR